MERRGAQHSEYERTQSATQRETAGMQRHGGAYMFKEAAAEWATDEVRKLNSDHLQESSFVPNVSSCAAVMNES